MIWVVFCILALFLGMGLYVFSVACPRRKEQLWLDEEAISKTDLASYYSVMVEADKWLREHSTDVWVKSYDGLKLHAYWAPAEKPIGTVVLMHGYRSTMLVDFGRTLAYYHGLGLNLLIPHQRSHGLSEGKMITFGVKEHRDLHTWVDYLGQHLYQGKVLVSGLSMGASTVLYTADEEFSQDVVGVIADCGFTSPRDILAKCFRDVTKLSGAPFMWAVNLWTRLLAGFGISQCDSRRCLANARRPVLLIHGTGDDFVPCSMSQEAFRHSNGSAQLLLIEGAGHGMSYAKDTEKYQETLKKFVSMCMEEKQVELRRD